MTQFLDNEDGAGQGWSLPASVRSRAAIGAATIGLIVAAIGIASPSLAVASTEDVAASQPAPAVGCARCAWSLAAIDTLHAEIAASGDEGLDPAAYHGEALRALAEAAGQSEVLDKAADTAALVLAQHYLHGRVADRARQSWYIARSDDDPAALASGLRAALAEGRLQPWLRSLLPGDPRYAALRSAYQGQAVTDAVTRARIRDNLERWRWLPRDLGAAHIFVNVPSYTLAVVDDGVPVSSYDVVVGAPATPTPQIAASARAVVVNPVWHVPPSIVRSSGMQAGKAGFVTSQQGGQLSFSQPPGPRNALGRIKIDMPNSDAIYLHDTPAKALFARTSRAFSHGCIRVKDIDRLAAELIRRDAGDPRRIASALTGYQTTPVRLHNARPVYIVYFTAEVGPKGALVMHDDPYGRDTRLSTRLAKLDVVSQAGTRLASATPARRQPAGPRA